MIVQIKRIIFLAWLFYLSAQAAISQTYYSSNDNYTGLWETPSTWNPVWQVPKTLINGDSIPSVTIYGYITINGSLSFTGGASNLIINDTLVIKGSLSLGNNNDLTINDEGILIIWGNLTLGNQTYIITNGYLIVTGNIYKGGTVYQGSWISNDHPVKLFIGGTLPAALPGNEDYPAVTCTPPVSEQYPNTGCSYGNMTDLANDPIYSFFSGNCSTTNIKTNISVCTGDTIKLTSSYGTAYNWSGPNGFTSTLQNPVIPDASPVMAGNYKIVVTNAICTDTDTTSVIVNAIPLTPTISASGPLTICNGDSVTLTSSEGSTYLWSTGATTQSIIVTTAGSYTVRVINTNGCKSAPSVSTVVTVNSLPEVTADNNGPVCLGSALSLTGGPDAMITYSWTGPVGFTSLVQSPYVSETAVLAMAGVYNLSGTDANGCSDTASTTVVVNTLPVVSAGADLTIPNGTGTTIDANVTGTGPFTYNWSPSGKLVNAFIEDPTTINLTNTTIFILTATSVATSCSNTAEVKVTISGGPLSSVPTASPDTICAGETIKLHALASGGSGSYTYTWTSTPAGFSSSAADPMVNPGVSTTYNVAVFDGFTAVNSQVAVTVNALPGTPTIKAGGPITFCAGGNVILTSSAGASYFWSAGATTESIDVKESGSFTVQITNASGCKSASSATTEVTVKTLPIKATITADGPTSFCTGGSVTLTSSAETGYLWSTGAITQSINVTTSGNYSVKVANASGCMSAASVAIIVTVYDLPVTPTITAGGPTTFCAGNSVMLTSSEGTDYLWSTGATTPNINVTTTGSFTVQITETNGCKSVRSNAIQVNVNALPVVTAGSNSPVCVGSAISLTSSGGTTYEWTGQDGFISIAQNPSISNAVTAMAGVYKVIVTGSNGCSVAKMLNVDVNENPVAIAGPDQDLKFVFETMMSAELSGSETGEWTLVSGSARISDIHSPVTGLSEVGLGKNIFTWKVASGNCSASDDVIISVEDLFIPSVITPNGDGKNDFFIINSLTIPDAEKVGLIILNKWGSVEYRNKNYANDWDGKNDRGVDLENDTYMYIMRFENGFTRKGTVLITR